MDYKLIRDLLDKYFQGNTSLEEETQLAAFFRQNTQMPDDIKAYAAWFGYLREQRAVKSSAPAPRMVTPAPARPFWIAIKTISRIAAVLLIGFGGFRLFSPRSQEINTEKTAAIDWSKYEAETPEEAFRLTSKALKRTSAELNRGAARAVEKVFNVKEQQ